MDAQAGLAITIPVVALTQFLKWSGVPDRLGAGVVLVLSALFVGLYVYASASYSRASLFDYVVAWISVATSAAGVYGFTRAASDSIVATRSPPAGAGQSPTVKSGA